jgi:S-formylglutathione hydrolase FrmB
MLPWSRPLNGRLDELTVTSSALVGNPLGDPHERPIWVHLPPGYDSDARRYPVIYILMGYGGLLPNLRLRQPYRPSMVEVVDEVLDNPELPFLAVYLDCWTAYGCGQYIDSPGTGRYHTFFCDEVVPFVDERYRTIAARESRAVTGKSSGGFGAMVTSMMRPDLFSVFATHAGDCLYETNYLREFGPAARALREYDADISKFWADFQSRTPFSKGTDQLLWLLLGIAACFSADDDGTVHLPFDTRTGRLREDVWARWLAWDPVRMLREPRYRDALVSLRAMWIDAGTADDFNLDLGAQAFHDGLIDIGVPADRIAFDLVDANHWTISHRFGPALRWVAEHLSS